MDLVGNGCARPEGRVLFTDVVERTKGVAAEGGRSKPARTPSAREMGGAPRNLAPRNHLLMWIVKQSGCHCTDGHLTIRVFPED